MDNTSLMASDWLMDLAFRAKDEAVALGATGKYSDSMWSKAFKFQDLSIKIQERYLKVGKA